jgi:hypothetical protein
MVFFPTPRGGGSRVVKLWQWLGTTLVNFAYLYPSTENREALLANTYKTHEHYYRPDAELANN